jgi:hypothetical protein
MTKKEELQQQLLQAEKEAEEGGKLVEQGRQQQHDAARKANDIKMQIAAIESEEQKAAKAES